MTMTTSDWTESGFRVLADLGPLGVFLTVQSQTITLIQSGERQRGAWALSQLTIPNGTPLNSSRNLVAHWLSFYADAALVELGVKALEEIYRSGVEPPAPEPGAPVSPQGALN